jgi:hypothetical protein
LPVYNGRYRKPRNQAYGDKTQKRSHRLKTTLAKS